MHSHAIIDGTYNHMFLLKKAVLCSPVFDSSYVYIGIVHTLYIVIKLISW